MLNKECFDIWLNRHAKTTYALEGEDMLLLRLFDGKRNGFYVDVGAHHPQRFSNTYLFYKLGWRGINIDPLPGRMKLFDQFRPRDINLEIGISQRSEKLTYYMFNEPALNSFSKEVSDTRPKKDYFITQEIPIETQPLASVLKKHLPAGQAIDFLNVDVEGLDLEVLQSNDWSQFRPKIVVCEVLESELATMEQKTSVGDFLQAQDYALTSKTTKTYFFIDKKIRSLT